MTPTEKPTTTTELTIKSLQQLIAVLNSRGIKVEYRKKERERSTSRAMVLSGNIRLLTANDRGRLSTLLGMIYTVSKIEVIGSAGVNSQELLIYHLEPSLKK